MAINLSIFAGDITAVLGSFNRIRVERSTTTELGPYTEITAPLATPATLLAGASGNYAVVGQTIEIKVNSSAPVIVTFTGTNPLTTPQVVSQINTALGAAIASDDANVLRLTSNLTGTVSVVEVISGTALGTLGFTAGDRDVGEEPYITLISGQENYPFTDDDGIGGYIYRTWFFHTGTLLESPRSAPFRGEPGTQVPSLSLSLATVDLIDLRGRALPNRKISIYPVSMPLIVDIYGVDLGRAGVIIETDNAGHAETNLVRGSQVKVVFEGTTFIRTIEVPDVSTFDLLTAVGAVPDQFSTAVIPNVPVAPRRTL